MNQFQGQNLAETVYASSLQKDKYSDRGVRLRTAEEQYVWIEVNNSITSSRIFSKGRNQQNVVFELIKNDDSCNLIQVVRNQHAMITDMLSKSSNLSFCSTSSLWQETKPYFLVVAGSYLIPSSAKKQKEKLLKLGFSKTDFIIFEDSEFYTVVVNKYENEFQATALLNKLKAKNIDAFIKKI